MSTGHQRSEPASPMHTSLAASVHVWDSFAIKKTAKATAKILYSDYSNLEVV